MRKLLEAISLAALAFQAWITYSALFGPDRLPARIPTHFDSAGNANAWGSPATLIFFPAMAISIYLLFTVVTRFPSAFNYPVRVTPQNRAQLETLALGMIAWLKLEIVLLFTVIQWGLIQASRHPTHTSPATWMPVMLIAVFATIGWHIAAMFRAGRSLHGL
jgi:uncharacterized membrane protein